MALRGDRLRELRENFGLTQEELAERLNLGIRQIHRYENEITDPSGDIIARLAKELYVTTDYLLGLVDDPAQDLTEEDLSPMERKLVDAVRKGLIVEALETITVISKRNDKSIIPPAQPAVNS